MWDSKMLATLVELVTLPSYVRIYLFLLMIFVALILNACSVLKLVQDRAPDSSSRENLDLRLVCSEECSDRGQCGKTDTGEVMVLLATHEPVLINHDLALAANTRITITQEETLSVLQVADEQQLEVSFYKVLAPDRREAWVAGWCTGS
jgi:hypothetical protein